MNGEHVITFTAGKSFLQIKTSFTQKSHHTHLWYSKEYQEGRRIVCGLWRSLLQCLRRLSFIQLPTNVAFLTFCTTICKFMFFSHNILQELAPWMINLNISHATKDALLYEQNDIHTIHNVSKNWHSLIKLIMWIYQTKSTPYQQSAKKNNPSQSSSHIPKHNINWKRISPLPTKCSHIQKHMYVNWRSTELQGDDPSAVDWVSEYMENLNFTCIASEVNTLLHAPNQYDTNRSTRPMK